MELTIDSCPRESSGFLPAEELKACNSLRAKSATQVAHFASRPCNWRVEPSIVGGSHCASFWEIASSESESKELLTEVGADREGALADPTIAGLTEEAVDELAALL